MTAFLLGGELVLKVHSGGARLNHRLGEFEGVEGPPKPASASATIRNEPIARLSPLSSIDMNGALQRVVNPPHQSGRTIDRVEALVGICLAS